MKNKFILFLVLMFVCLLCASCTDQSSLAPSETITSQDIYVDKSSDAGFGFHFCYVSQNNNESVGLAKADGSILMSPDYLSVNPITENRFIVRRFIEQSPHTALLDSDLHELIPFFRGEIRQINGMSDENVLPILSVEPLEGSDFFTDSDGNKIIDQEFLTTHFTEDGLFFGVTQDAYFFFDVTGKELCKVCEGETAVLSPLEHGYQRLVKKEGTRFRYGVQTPDGNEIVPCEYDQVKVPYPDRIVARIGDWYGLDASDVVRIFDGTGRRLTADGDYSNITFSEDCDFGIAAKFNEDSTVPDGYSITMWVVNKNGEKVSDAYDSIDITDHGFTAKKANQTIQMNPDGSIIQTNNT